MKEKPNSTHITLWANRSIALILTVLLFALHPILDWYCTVRTLTVHERGAITVAFYICAVIVFFALWQMEKLLKNLLAKQVFLRENVSSNNGRLRKTANKQLRRRIVRKHF